MPESATPTGLAAVRALPRRSVGAALLLLAALVAPLIAPTPAWAASSVSVAYPAGAAAADPDYATALTLSGSGFQTVKGGFGGIYVLFGWVGSSWRPSEGGVVGADYRYLPDQESKDNAGFQRFVAFPGSDTEAAANAVLGLDGSWSVDMVVPGAVFESVDRSGSVSEVDCREVQCGIITIGAHGVKNANNETFTPVSFAAPAASSAAAATEAAPAVASGAARVGYTGDSVTAGNALSFTGQGFTPGEQVVATLDDGVAAVGPLIAGGSGEVAAVMTLPADLRAGTHLLTLTGAASASTAETEVTVTAAGGSVIPATTAASATAEASWPYLLLGVAVLVALLLVIVSVIASIARARRARRARGASRGEAVESSSAASASASADTEVLQGVNR